MGVETYIKLLEKKGFKISKADDKEIEFVRGDDWIKIERKFYPTGREYYLLTVYRKGVKIEKTFYDLTDAFREAFYKLS